MNWKQCGITTVLDPNSGTEHGPDADPHSDLNLVSSLDPTLIQDPNPSPNPNNVHKNQKVETANIYQWQVHKQSVVKGFNLGSGFSQSSRSGFGFRVSVRI